MRIRKIVDIILTTAILVLLVGVIPFSIYFWWYSMPLWISLPIALVIGVIDFVIAVLAFVFALLKFQEWHFKHYVIPWAEKLEDDKPETVVRVDGYEMEADNADTEKQSSQHV